jgi:hypothetical protein
MVSRSLLMAGMVFSRIAILRDEGEDVHAPLPETNGKYQGGWPSERFGSLLIDGLF